MTAYVYVSLKKSVLDPQGKTIQGALKKMGYKGLEDVRQGKYFEITLDGGLSRDQAQAEVERMAREVLTNAVIEEFRFSLADCRFLGVIYLCVGSLATWGRSQLFRSSLKGSDALNTAATTRPASRLLVTETVSRFAAPKASCAISKKSSA